MNDTNTMRISESPALTQACEFVKHFPNALVAGGVARDIILGQEFNDVDIFIRSRRDASEAAKLIIDIQRQCQAMRLDLKVQDTYYPRLEVKLTAGVSVSTVQTLRDDETCNPTTKIVEAVAEALGIVHFAIRPIIKITDTYPRHHKLAW